MNFPDFRLRDWTQVDAQAVLVLNHSEIPHVSALTEAELLQLARQSQYFKVAETSSGEMIGFLLALEETAVYDSLNFLWFKKRYPKFTYVDRIVISSAYQRRGLGKIFYEDLKAFASLRSPSLLTCEVNLRPPNPSSIIFHQKLGFREVGTQDTEAGQKTVSLMIREI